MTGLGWAVCRKTYPEMKPKQENGDYYTAREKKVKFMDILLGRVSQIQNIVCTI